MVYFAIFCHSFSNEMWSNLMSWFYNLLHGDQSAAIFAFEVLAWVSTLFQLCEATWCLDYIIYYMVNSWPLYSVGFMEWGGGSEECKEVRQLKHFCPFLFLQFFKNREYYFGTLPLFPQLVVLLGQLLKEAKVGLHLPGGVQIILSLFVYYCYVIMWFCASPCYVMCMW